MKEEPIFLQVVKIFENGERRGLANGYTIDEIGIQLYGAGQRGKPLRSHSTIYGHVRKAREYFDRQNIMLACFPLGTCWIHFIPAGVQEAIRLLEFERERIIKSKRWFERRLVRCFKSEPALRGKSEFLDGNYIQLELDLTPKMVTSMPYAEYLQSEHWQHVRRAKLAEASECEAEGKHDGALEVHHKHYDTLGKESLDDLIVLCAKHHTERHGS